MTAPHDAVDESDHHPVGSPFNRSSLAVLALLGAVGAKAGGANIPKAMARVMIWGALAMAATAAIGSLVGAAV